MKLLSLNTAGATQEGGFYDYISSLLGEVDIFCFQEVFKSEYYGTDIKERGDMQMYEKLKQILKEYNAVFLKKSSGRDFISKVNFQVEHGLAVFFKKNIQIQDHKECFSIFPSEIQHPVEGMINCQKAICLLNGKSVLIMNYHGPAQPGNKLDTDERIAVSEKLKQIWEEDGSQYKILCGDFNLMPETQSIKILDEISINLIKKYNIQNTRNEISWAKYNNKQRFADFCFVSENIEVKNFEVPYNLASDHLPMVLDFDI